MNKWFCLALNSFIGIVIVNLLYSLIFGGWFLVGFSFTAILALGIKLLYFLMVTGLIAGTFIAVKEFVFSKE